MERKGLLKLGYKCNNKCLFCHEAGKKEDYTLSKEETKRRTLILKNLGANYIVLSGGEPTIIEYLPKIVKIISNNNMKSEIITNARLLSNKILINKLKNAGLYAADVSIHSIGKEHDNLTRSIGSFNETIQGLKNLNSVGTLLKVNIVVTKKNLNSIKKLVKKIAKDFKNVNRIKLSFVEPKGAALKNFNEIVPFIENAAKTVKKALEYGNNKNVNITFDGFPLCLLKGFENNYEDILSGNLIARWSAEKENFELSEEIKDNEKIKIEACKKCSSYNKCSGLYREYLKRNGFEFKPY